MSASAPAPPAVNEQTYHVTECDSVDSLGLDEREDSALLKEEEKSQSENSLLIFFDGTDVQDTCV